MQKVKFKIVILGHLPIDFNKKKIEKWKSDIFEVSGIIENYKLISSSDEIQWTYSDETLLKELPDSNDSDVLITIVNVPLTLNWYSRRIAKNKIVFTFYEIKDILKDSNIPLENAIFRILYAYSLAYIGFNRRIPSTEEIAQYAHDETRGCLHDMTGIKSELIYSCHKPQICSECLEMYRGRKVSSEYLHKIQKEINRIQKDIIYQMIDYIKIHPIISLVISSIYAIFMGIIGSLIASVVWCVITKNQ